MSQPLANTGGLLQLQSARIFQAYVGFVPVCNQNVKVSRLTTRRIWLAKRRKSGSEAVVLHRRLSAIERR